MSVKLFPALRDAFVCDIQKQTMYLVIVLPFVSIVALYGVLESLTWVEAVTGYIGTL